MKGKVGHKILKATGWFFAVLLLIVIVVPALLYIPAVQNFVKDIALKEVKKSSGMDISVGKLRLRFPLKIEVSDVAVVEASGDTMLTAALARLAVRPAALLKLDLDVSGVELEEATYRLGSPDSTLFLTAAIRRFDLDQTDLSLRSGAIDVGTALLDGATVSLAMRPDTAASKTDTAASKPMTITARRIEIRDVTYRMSMLPTIDSLGARIDDATLTSALVDMGARRISADSLGVLLATATYLTPTAEYLKAHPAPPAAKADTAAADTASMWTVTARAVTLRGDTATYAMRGAIPRPGLDMNYLEATAIEIRVDSFRNRGVEISVPLRRLKATERCGVSLDSRGLFAMDSRAMHADSFAIETGYSRLAFDATMGMGDLASDPSLPLDLDATGSLALEDVEMALPSLAPMLRGTPRGASVALRADISGTTGDLAVETLSADWPRFLTFAASGRVRNPFDSKQIDGRVDFRADAIGLNAAKPTLLDAKLAREINIPRTLFNGSVNYSPNLVSGRLNAVTSGGRIALDGSWNQQAEGYDASFRATDFPVDAFMPSLGVGKVTASITARGRGLDFARPSTSADLKVDLQRAEYLSETYRDILLDANLAKGAAEGRLRSANPSADMDLGFTATLADTGYTWNLSGNVANIDLMGMKLSPTPSGGSLGLASKGSFDPKRSAIDATLDVTDLKWTLDKNIISTPRIAADLQTSDSTVDLRLVNGDLTLTAAATCSLDSLMAHISETSAAIDSMMAARRLDAVRLQHALPPLTAVIEAGTDNVARQFLDASDMGFNRAVVTFHNDSLVNLSASVIRFRTGSALLDTISFAMNQHGRYLAYKAQVNNRPGTMDQFARVSLTGFVAEDKLTALLRQENIKGEKGFQLGLAASFGDSAVTVRFVPFTPTIGYKPWTLNSDNFVTFNFATKHLDANLEASSGKSLIHLYTKHSDSTAATAAGNEEVVLKLSEIHLSDWLSVSPFAPPVKGDLGADMRFHWDSNQLTGRGTLDLTDLYYGRDRVGDFELGVDLTNSSSGAVHADVSLLVDSAKVITATGTLNDSTAAEPFMLDFSMIRFPLQVVNPFLPKEYARLSGTLNGRMDITGELSAPVFNGYLDFDSSAVKVPMLGTSFLFPETEIPVDSNIVRFRDFAIKACNDNPLTINGTVDARHLTDIAMDLTLAARNMQIVNSSRPRGAQVYGKAFIDADASVRGNMQFIDVDATLNLLAGTNVTYVVEASESALTSQSTTGMVTFIQFNDTTQVEKADSISRTAMMMNLDANLIISQGSTINADLPGDGQNKVTIQGEGNLNYSMTPFNDGRLTGRFTINSGMVRYSPPVISTKTFEFTEGSYIAFTGDMLNPSLNISATDKIKANVTQEGQNSRLVDFLVTVTATNTLENLDVKFDLSTDNDITIENELTSMSEQQRANQAMNLLLYNTYTGPDTKASANLSGNPLFSFLTSQLNSWAANNIKGVDISFGIDQYDKTTDGAKSTTTSYSYRVSKTLFNDRFKIIVGGNYSSDADTDENFSENLINDVSFEYMLNRSGSMYIRLFRHTGYESILEGEVTQTGVGFVYKRKVNSLRDIFRFLYPRRRRRTPPTLEPPAAAPAEPAPAQDSPTTTKTSEKTL
ncbi:MAG: translocation/assembly module TamB domain-containing protein [Clostridium sp.]|nr:translocation/assembly module TamB domain-containing protein [Clostridium sp.]